MPLATDSRVTMADAHAAVSRGGGKPSRLAKDKFTFSSKVCHGGDSPAGCWAKPNDHGDARFFCHSCGPQADAQIRKILGLPAWQPAYTADKPGYDGKAVTLTWDYNNNDTGESLAQVIDFRPAGTCKDPDCADGKAGRRCKHPWLKREDRFLGTPIAGFHLHHHKGGREINKFIVLCEGQTAADRVAEAGYSAFSYVGGANGAALANYAACQGQNIAISPDNDPPGQIAALESAVRALDAGATAVHIMNPIAIMPGADLADISPTDRMKLLASISRGECQWRTDKDELKLELAEAKFRRAIWIKTQQDGRRLLSASTYQDFSAHSKTAWEYIAHWNERLLDNGESPRIYRNEHSAVEIAPGDRGPTTRRLETAAAMRLPSADAILWHQGYSHHRIALLESPADAAEALGKAEAKSHAFLSREDTKDGPALVMNSPKFIYPKDELLGSMAKAPSFSLPHLQSIARCPYIHRGKMVLTEGYNPGSEVFLNLVGAEIQPMPMKDAVKAWRRLLQDFPFKADADLAAVMAYALTPLIRYHVRKAPSFLFNKPASRTGASLLVSLIVSIITGSPSQPNVIPATREEFRKEIMTILYNGNTMPVLDNVEDKLDDPTLAMAITTETARGRILGKTEEVQLSSIHATWAATGNKMSVGTDFIGRSVICNLDARVSSPGERTGPTTGDRAGQNWAIPVIADHVLENRSLYLSALVSMIQAWLDAKCPAPKWNPPVLGGFEEWHRWISGILDFCGFKDLMENKAEFAADADTEANEAAQFVLLWWETHKSNPVTVQMLYALAGYESVEAGTEQIVSLDKPSPKAMGGFLRRKVKGLVFELPDGDTVHAQLLKPRNSKEAGRWQLQAQDAPLL